MFDNHIYVRFRTSIDCFVYLEKIRWNNKPKCPYCDSEKFSRVKNCSRYHCNACNSSYSVTVGTIFHRTRIDLRKWFVALALLRGTLIGISIRVLSEKLELNKNTVLYLIKRYNLAMTQNPKFIIDIVESDKAIYKYRANANLLSRSWKKNNSRIENKKLKTKNKKLKLLKKEWSILNID